MMVNSSTRHEDNAPGSWYIDDTCTVCEACIDEAPNNIKASDSEDHAIVFKQPETPEEEEQMKAAMDLCPTESIKNDG